MRDKFLEPYSIAENTEADADAVAATETIVQEKEPESMSECVAQEVSQESESVAEEITEVATADVPMGECIVSEVEENVANEEPTIIEDDIKPQGDNSMAYSYEQTNTVDSVMDVAEVNETPSVEDNVALSSCEEPQPVPVVEETPVVEDIPHVQVEAGEEEKEEPQPVHIEQPQNIEEKPIQSMEETVVAAEPEKVEPTRLTLGEQLGQTRQESLNDKFANNKSADLSSRIGLKPISDIRSSIGLGERYRFTRMLFSGNGSAYDAAVAKLNEMSSIEEAENYVRTNFYWDMESPIVADFMNIVRRRYL